MHDLTAARRFDDFIKGLDLSSLPFFMCRFVKQALLALLVSGRCLVTEKARALTFRIRLRT